MALKLITPPAVEPLTLEEMKLYLRLDGSELDNVVLDAITAAREYVEGYLNRRLITQTWEQIFDSWPEEKAEIEIALPPLQAVESVQYHGTDGTEYTFDSSNYIVDPDSFMGRIILTYGCSWPGVSLQPASAIRIRFICGYGTADHIPKKIKQALKMLVTHWVEHPEAVIIGSMSKEVEFAVTALLGQDRVVPI